MNSFPECQRLAALMNLKIEKPGVRHDYEAAMEDKPCPKYVLKHRMPTYDMQVYWSTADLLWDLQKEYESFLKFNAEIAAKRESNYE